MRQHDHDLFSSSDYVKLERLIFHEMFPLNSAIFCWEKKACQLIQPNLKLWILLELLATMKGWQDWIISVGTVFISSKFSN
jgi:hypothetical protein